MPTPTRHLVAAGTTLLGVALVSLAARAARPDAAVGEVVRWWPLAVAVVLLAAASVAALVLLAKLRPVDLDGGRGSGGTSRSTIAGLVLLVGAVFLLPGAEESAEELSGGEGLAPLLLPEPVGEAVRDITLAPSGGAVLVLVGLVGLLGVLAVRRGRATHAAGPGPVLAAAVAEAEHRLRSASTPREAVLLAFAGLEEAFARHGAGRRASETQTAWVERLLVEHGAPGEPARRLRRLFERARFADTTTSSADQREAQAALAALVQRQGAP